MSKWTRRFFVTCSGLLCAGCAGFVEMYGGSADRDSLDRFQGRIVVRVCRDPVRESRAEVGPSLRSRLCRWW